MSMIPIPGVYGRFYSTEDERIYRRNPDGTLQPDSTESSSSGVVTRDDAWGDATDRTTFFTSPGGGFGRALDYATDRGVVGWILTATGATGPEGGIEQVWNGGDFTIASSWPRVKSGQENASAILVAAQGIQGDSYADKSITSSASAAEEIPTDAGFGVFENTHATETCRIVFGDDTIVATTSTGYFLQPKTYKRIRVDHSLKAYWSAIASGTMTLSVVWE